MSFEDLAPTILGFSKSGIPDYMKGINISKNSPPEREFFSSRARMDDQPMRSYFVRDKSYQYIRNIDKTPGGAKIDFRDTLKTMDALNKGHLNNSLTTEQEQWFENKSDEELYDLKKDPCKPHSMAQETLMSERLNYYRQKLDEWRNTSNDMSTVPESDMVKDLLDNNGQQKTTLSPVVERDDVTEKIYIANRTENASIGYSFDGEIWEIYTGSISNHLF
ncbi:hypothetical protein [Tolumonas auensis]|uniref:hypothetical protein n=1 Tax=Tolumonas auensis TaxID=43948 RepID=UPI002AA7EBEF|nr:hypothetical protein [Tolumonas auensis]